jgi:hypothetical protein
MADMKAEVAKIKEKYKSKSVISAGTPIRMLGQYIANKQMKNKSKQEINKLIMKVDDLKLDGETRKVKNYIKSLTIRSKRKLRNEKLDNDSR